MQALDDDKAYVYIIIIVIMQALDDDKVMMIVLVALHCIAAQAVRSTHNDDNSVNQRVNHSSCCFDPGHKEHACRHWKMMQGNASSLHRQDTAHARMGILFSSRLSTSTAASVTIIEIIVPAGIGG